MLVVTFAGAGAGIVAPSNGDPGLLGEPLDGLLHLPLAALGDRARGDLGGQRVLGGALGIDGRQQRVFEPHAFGAKRLVGTLHRSQRVVGTRGGLGKGRFELGHPGGMRRFQFRDLRGVDGVAFGGPGGRGGFGRVAGASKAALAASSSDARA